jgi:type IV pilus assembly protein PilM
MFGFVQNIFAPPAHPIGVDFGAGTLRLAQVQSEGDDFKLLAAASAEIPAEVRDDPDARLQFFAESARNLLTQGKFHGRRAVLGLPSSVVHIQHLTVEHVEEKLLRDAIQAQARLKLPFDPAHALLRHAVAGQSPDKDDPRLHVVVMAADTRWVNQYIAAAKKARLDVIGMNMPQLALIDCFANVYRRASDQQSVRMYVDIGGSGTRVSIAQGTRLLFARNFAIGGDHLTAAVAEALGISLQNARTLRLKLGAGGAENSDRVDAVCAKGLENLANELDRCRVEHESLFPNLKVQRLIFVGGEARLEALCQQISDQLKIPGQTGDSLCRMVRNSRIGIESAIDRRRPQPAWSAAVGLSIGPPHSDR